MPILLWWCVFGKFKCTWIHTLALMHSVKTGKQRKCIPFLSVPHPTSTPLRSVQIFSQWESELWFCVLTIAIYVPLSKTHSVWRETPMLPDLLSTVKDPVWLEGRQRSGHSFTVHWTVLLSQRQSNLTLIIILGRHFSFALGIPAVLYNTKHIPLSNQPLPGPTPNSVFLIPNVQIPFHW